MILAFFAAGGLKRITDMIPWKLVFAALIALALWVGGHLAYRTISDLQTKVAAQAVMVEVATKDREIAEANAREITRQHDEQMRRLQALEDHRSLEGVEMQGQRTKAKAQTRTITKEFQRDPTEAVRALRARERELNRMLERSAAER